MILFVGLGNPGKEYEGTRHNLGFDAIDAFARKAGVSFDRTGFKGEYGILRDPVFRDSVLVLKPTTFMNLSGESVQACASFYRIPPEEIYVAYDEMAIPEGAIRIRPSGSSGGHKGIGSIIQLMGTEKIARIRLGIGEPPFHNPVDYVLGKPGPEARKKIDLAVEKAADAFLLIATKGLETAMSRINQRG